MEINPPIEVKIKKKNYRSIYTGNLDDFSRSNLSRETHEVTTKASFRGVEK